MVTHEKLFPHKNFFPSNFIRVKENTLVPLKPNHNLFT
jgi:hypothetical protein